MANATVIPGLDPASYRPHALHGATRIWPETNCSVDLTIEVVHALGGDPTAALGFTVTQDFEGDQFTFFKVPQADLEALFGIETCELSVFDDLGAHVALQIERGRLPLVEVDAFFLPDTRDVSYRTAHSKTTIGINRIDVAARRIEYFHNAGFFALSGEDFDGIFGVPGSREHQGLPLFPYTEYLKVRPDRAPRDIRATARGLLVRHLARRPVGNPIRAYAEAFPAHAVDLATRAPAYFHTYAFNTMRMVGSNFELLAAHLDWLDEPGLAEPRTAAIKIAEDAKAAQFKLARAMARQKFEPVLETIDAMAGSWDAAMTGLDAWAAGAETRAAA